MLKYLLLPFYFLVALSLSAQLTFFTEDFESGSGFWTATDDLTPNFWVTANCGGNGSSYPGTFSSYVTFAGAVSGCGQLPAYTNAGSGTLMATYYTTIDASCFNTLELNFDYLVEGVLSEDVAQVVYSTNGGASWTQIGSDLGISATWTSATLLLPGALDGTQFLLGFRFVYNDVNAVGSGLRIDNVEVAGTGELVPPVMTCLSSIDLSVNSSCQAIVGDYTKDIVTLSDNCSDSVDIIVTQDIPEFTVLPFGPGGSQVIVITATDEAGNPTTCNVTLNIIDEIPPTLTCPADTNIFVNANCEALITDYLAGAIVSDNCTSLAAITLSQAPPSGTIIVGEGIATPVTFTATDLDGNSSTCQFIARTVDTLVATIICPSDSNVYFNSSCQYLVPDFSGDVIAFDNCLPFSSLTISQSPPSSTLVTTNQVVTMTVSGGFPNIDQSCTFNLLLVDTISPSIICPIPTNLFVDANCSVVVPDYSGSVIISDNCGGSFVIGQSPLAGSNVSGATTFSVTMTVTDPAGNSSSCSFNQPVLDAILPVVTCPGNQLEPADANCFAVLGNYIPLASATDNCSSVFTYSQSPVSGTLISSTTLVTIQAMDQSGNTGNCSFNVGIQDLINPTVTCPSNTTLAANALCLGVLPDYTSSAVGTDNCTPPASLVYTQTPPPSTNLPIGTQNVLITVFDAAGNSSVCSFDVLVFDATAPSLICPPNQTTYADMACSSVLGDYTGLITASDNCSSFGNLTIGQTPASGISINTDTQITITVVDESLNSVSCNFNVLLIDTIRPVITCPGDQFVSINSNCEYFVPNLSGLVTGSDNCSALGNMVITQNPPAGSLQNGITPVLITLIDEQGNSNSCWTNLIPADTVAPSIICPNPAPVNVGTSCDFILPFYGSQALVLDNCSNFSILQSPVQGSLVNTGTNSITLTVIDAGGNSDQCTFDLLVFETEIPTITCPSSISTCDPLVTYSAPNYGDNCAVSLNQTDGTGLSSGMTFPVGITLLEYTAVDSSGNQQTCSFNVEVLDFPSPANIAEDTLFLCNQSSTLVNADPITSGSGLWTLEEGTCSFNNQFSNQTGINNIGFGTSVLAWTVSSASCGTLSDTLVIVNSPLDLQASTQDTIITCAQPQIILEANTPLYGIGTWTTDGTALIADVHSSSTTAHLGSSGWQYFVWTITNGSCPTTTDTLLVLGNIPPSIFTLGTSVCLEEEPISLSASPAVNGVSTSWSVSGEAIIDDPNAANTSVSGLSLGINIITYSSAYPGCPTVDDTIAIIGTLCADFEPIFPTVITPNYDGHNDLFIINFLEKLYPECRVVIFNRWGSVVFESVGYADPWDGTFKGEPLPMGTYFYTIELNDDEGTTYRGDISIIH
ncbi:MAG: hypothetical protein A3D92_19520 [Bacteroidetes bacterium RIFCSPHIGHO2_02_FULL_44_7]|nr:MAG: hypothetical protein A3D92_19520 [Bacteroidetes bacterium RIFCSPHIGHO2_02_FULL_44_7]